MLNHKNKVLKGFGAKMEMRILIYSMSPF